MNDCEKDNKDYRDLSVLTDYLDKNYDWKNEKSRSQLETRLKSEWKERQLHIIEDFSRIDFIFMNRKIAIIETRDITSTDSQKIFNLINTGERS